MINYLYFIFYYSVCTSNYTVNITHSWNNYTYTLNFLQNEINDMYKTHISWIILNWYKENYKIDGKIRTECLTVSNFVHNNNIYITINCITGMTNGNLSTHNETILITKDDFLTELAHINIFLWIMMGVLLLIITYILYMLLIMIPLIKNFQEDNSENDMEEAEQDVEEIIDINTNIPNTTNNNIESNIENTFFYKILYISLLVITLLTITFLVINNKKNFHHPLTLPIKDLSHDSSETNTTSKNKYFYGFFIISIILLIIKKIRKL